MQLLFLVTCETLTLENGNVTYNTSLVGNGYLATTTASFSCHVGYTVSGPLSRMCQESGDWTGTNPRCVQGDEINNFNYIQTGYTVGSMSHSTSYRRIALYFICKCFLSVYLGKIFITKPGLGSIAMHHGIGSSASSQALLKASLFKFLNYHQSPHCKKV